MMLWSIPLLPLIAAALLYGWWRTASRVAIAASATGVALVTIVLVTLGIVLNGAGSVHWNDTLTLQLGLTPFTALFALVVPLVAAPIMVYAAAQEDRHGLARLISLMLAFTGVMELLILAKDLLTLLIAWEIVGALSWALIGQHYTDPNKTRHAAQAFLTTRFGDLGLYLAAFIAFSQTGQLDYASLSQLHGTPAALVTAGLLLAATAKSAQLPFAPWLFSAMSGPAPVSALLHSATMVAAGVIVLVQLQPTLSGVAWFGPVTVAIGLVTALAGGAVALVSPHGKRLLAGSTSAHYGLMFVALGAGYPVVAALHFVAHAMMKGPLFLVVGMAGDHAGSYQLGAIRKSAFSKRLKLPALAATLALAGLIPLGAAWTKEAIVTAAGQVGVWAALATAIAGGLSAAYAARLMYSLFPAGASDQTDTSPDNQRLQRGAINALVLATVLLSLLWIPGGAGSISSALASTVPPFKAWELLVSMALVIAGLVLGTVLAKQARPAAESGTVTGFVSNWLGLASLARRLVAEPALWVARALAQMDDRVVDAGIRGTARLTLWIGSFGDRVGEWLFDEMPEGLARLSGIAGRQLRQLQSGMLHHYYFIIFTGVIAIVITFTAGALTGVTP